MLATSQQGILKKTGVPRGNTLLQLLDRHVEGRLAFIVDGETIVVGQSADPGRIDATVRVNDAAFFRRVLAAGNLGLGEAYMERQFEIVDGSLENFLLILLRSGLDKKITKDPRAVLRILGIRLLDTLRGKVSNITRHYDIGDDLFESFLDARLTYSCGYAKSADDDVNQLQFNKFERICQKLRLRPGERLLDIGCGYGGLLIHAAKHYGVTGTGITISRHHCDRGNEEIKKMGLAERAQIRFEDHLKIQGRFDKVVSVGMLEHVPRREYRPYFRNIARVLTPDGFGLVHAIGCNAARNEHDPFIQKYIFPASNQPRLSEIAVHLEKNSLAILDVENMVRHYAITGRRWLERFRAAKLDTRKYDDTFRRMWEYYLACGIAAMAASDTALYQVLFTKNYAAELPLQRV